VTLRNPGKLLARIEVLEREVAKMCPGPKNRLLWGQICEYLADLRAELSSRPQTSDTVQQIEEIKTWERRLQALDPNNVDRETLEEIVGHPTLCVVELLWPMVKRKRERFAY
jgi:hypothetical protein